MYDEELLEDSESLKDELEEEREHQVNWKAYIIHYKDLLIESLERYYDSKIDKHFIEKRVD